MGNKNIIYLITLSILLLVQCTKKDNPTPYNPQGIFNTVWNDFDKTYPYFVHKNINWDSVYTFYYSTISDNTSSQQLFETIGEMTLGLKDIHVNLSSSLGTYHYSKKENYPENPPDNAFNYLSGITLDNEKAIFGSIKNSNFSYLRIKTFVGNQGDFEAAVSSLDSLEKTDGVIIDIRHNGGGNELNGRAFAGRFIQSETHFKNTRIRNGDGWGDFTDWNQSFFQPNKPIQFDKKIIILTNRRVYSSAELFVLMMKTYPRLVIVGDTTGGASANPSEKTLPNGWKYRVSTWQAADLNYNLIEDNGIPPDHYVLMTEASINDHRDLILQKGIELLDDQ